MRRDIDFERFFTISLDMLCISNADGYFKVVSPAFTRTLGWSVEELTTKPFSYFVHPDDLEATMQEVARQVERGESVLQFENRYLCKDGSYRVLSWKSVPQEGGYMYAVARDVTERKHLELSLQEARDEAVRANRAKSEFLSRMSHELRTPLNGILGFAQLIELQYQDERIHELTGHIIKGGHHLLALINEVLDIARIEAGKLTVSLEPVPIESVFGQAMGLIQPLADAEGVLVQYDNACSDAHVVADKQRLLQVFINLLSNGVKYNRVGGTLAVRCTLPDPTMHRIEFTDTGMGINRDLSHLLFQPFERLGQDTGQGTGLGLALSKQLVELMGGSLTLAQTGPEGTTFVLELKCATSPIEERAFEPARAHEPPAPGARVLCIEDNLSNLKLLEHLFSSWEGLTLIPAMQGSIGLELARQHAPDLILLDVHLPDMGGAEVLRKLKSDPSTAGIPVVVISADATGGQMRLMTSLGAQSYITKPLDVVLLTRTVESLLAP
jgi:PAS domain S-box-containing protein